MSCCDSTTSSNGMDPKQGEFKYTGYDSTGIKIVQGKLFLDFSDSTNIKGTWEIEEIKMSQNIGPQIGSGELIGSYYDSNRVWINLNPDYDDNNIILRGILNNKSYEGNWKYSTFVGVVNYGPFEAVRNQ